MGNTASVVKFNADGANELSMTSKSWPSSKLAEELEKRSDLSKNGKALLCKFVDELEKKSYLSEDDKMKAYEKELNTLLESHPVPAIQMIKFDKFVEHGTFPRCPDNRELCVELGSIDRDNSLFVFISHCWMRGYAGAEGWSGKPHPDNVNGDKYALCVRGIDKLLKSSAHRMKDCYVWLDFGCINQDGNPAGELEQLDKIVQCCDCIFTPIVDVNHENWQLPDTINNWYDEYKAPLWNKGPHAYLNRGWCRVEMLYAANIPVLKNVSTEVERHSMFEAGLALHCRENRRPHYLYGTKEVARLMSPYVLPPLQHSYLTDYHPLKGSLSVASDVEHIACLISELKPYLDANVVNVGYVGSKNDKGQKHGLGAYRYASNDVYEGEYKDDKMDGHGTFRYASGSVYVGEYKNDKQHGRGTFKFASGDVYDGEYKDDNMHGHGTFRYASGSVYDGEYKDNMRHGRGIIRNAFSDVYDGEWKDDKMHGHGTRKASGTVYNGEYKDNLRHGHGIFKNADGDVYDGEWKDDKMHGHGTFKYDEGVVFDGEYKDGKQCGHGTYRYFSGDVYDGEYKDGKKHGHGKYHYEEGAVYDGEYKNGKQCGHGIFTSASGNVYDGEYKDGKKHGLGTYRCVSGDVYDGEYKDGKKHGHGTYRYASGDVYDGEYNNNKQCGHGTYRYASGDVYVGDFKDDKHCGHGTYRYASGDVYDGEFKDDKKHGLGILRRASGDVYDGEWKRGFQHGQGVFRSAAGDVVQDGEWKEDVWCGAAVVESN